jgi:signal transduction histidine kinase
LKELGEMAAMVAHEIRNPLGGIKGFASLLERDLKQQPELAKMAGYIIEGTDTLNRLVNTILNYSRPIQPRLETTDLVALMHELVEHIQADPSFNPNIHIHIHAKKQPVAAPVDPAILKSAILNLLVNSIQAMPQGGQINLNVGKEKGDAIIQVTDTGTGIPEENMEKLFSPFFTTRSDGNGFGLAEVHKVVQAHAGTIEAISALGKGTTFTLKLPLHVGTKDGN